MRHSVKRSARGLASDMQLAEKLLSTFASPLKKGAAGAGAWGGKPSSAAATESTSATSAAAAAAASAPLAVRSVLDPTVSRNLFISLRGSSSSSSHVLRAIATLDTAALGGADTALRLASNALLFEEDKVGKPLRAYLESADEQGAATATTTPAAARQQRLSLLPPHERLAAEICCLPGARQLLSVMATDAAAAELQAGVCARLGLLARVCTEVLASEGLATLLRDVILPLGNRLNEGSGGSAQGFRLASLGKLVQTKGVSGQTFLQFIVEGLLERAPGLCEVAGGEGSLNLPSLASAKGAAISRQQVQEDMARLEACSSSADSLLAGHRRRVAEEGAATATAAAAGSPPSDAQLALGRLESISASVRRLAEDCRRARALADAQFSAMCKYLGEDAGRAQPEEVLRHLQGFTEALGRDAAAGRARREREARAAKKAAAAAAAVTGPVAAAAAAAARARVSVRGSGGGGQLQHQLLQQQLLLSPIAAAAAAAARARTPVASSRGGSSSSGGGQLSPIAAAAAAAARSRPTSTAYSSSSSSGGFTPRTSPSRRSSALGTAWSAGGGGEEGAHGVPALTPSFAPARAGVKSSALGSSGGGRRSVGGGQGMAAPRTPPAQLLWELHWLQGCRGGAQREAAARGAGGLREKRGATDVIPTQILKDTRVDALPHRRVAEQGTPAPPPCPSLAL